MIYPPAIHRALAHPQTALSVVQHHSSTMTE
jgi:hypothetical protein